MKLEFECILYTLDFKFEAGTSRGVLKTKTSYFIKAKSPSLPGRVGWGEAGPLPKLSLDHLENLQEVISAYALKFEELDFPESVDGVLNFLQQHVSHDHPSVRFAFEVAILDLINGRANLFAGKNTQPLSPIKINGLIWMGDREFMLEQIDQKLRDGYDCIKMKIGAIDFEEECRILAHIRNSFGPDQITLRVDANGAFAVGEARAKLDKLAEFGLHSIEQPIRQGQWQEMAKLCEESPVDIALDEELIGVYGEQRANLLDVIRPPYVILKPTLLGGIWDTQEWIDLAEGRNIGWWMTSALESNIGLNAIYQLTSLYRPHMPQGLGTGQLYHNNIDSPLTIESGFLSYSDSKSWVLPEK
ncbi:o-succinylbenzoate synthase [Litoribacter ruber]|uniref:o-succinylbenzoate synthase n=1 Tax=Litoribacter ruber TaxID=702568 RepID=UPI001BDA0EE2|nr:o-succinylbenzoate synthase [Litoribacter ruber]MBT0811691.1 o-succinylbenzoate synthase [Litoribacter ruber]